MLDINLLRKDIKFVSEKLLLRGFVLNLDKFNELENKRKNLQIDLEKNKAIRNKKSSDVGAIKRNGGDIEQFMQELSGLSDHIQVLDEALKLINNEMNEFLSIIPNLPDESVPEGLDENNNLVVEYNGSVPVFDFTVLDHSNLCQKTMSFEQGVAIAGSRFVVLHDQLAKLNRALINWMLDTHSSNGYHEVNVPYLANEASLFGTAQLPKFAEEQYKIGEDGLYLIPTAEVPITNLYRDSIISYKDLPKKFAGYSACFRREAGSYGKDTKGMIRLHQFEKVELVKFVLAENAYDEHESLTRDAEMLLQSLGLAYRKVLLCTGDMGFASAKTYDLEVWLPSQNTYREISSCSLFTDFQSRRLKTRVKLENGDITYPYTLNGSGLAVGRTLLAILENYQLPNGDVRVPEVLVPYMHGIDIIERVG